MLQSRSSYLLFAPYPLKPPILPAGCLLKLSVRELRGSSLVLSTGAAVL